LQRYDAKIIEKGVTLADALAAFKDWNATIDSAFTRIRIPRWFRDQPAPDSAMTDQTLSRLVRLLERGERPGAAEPRP
jgi:hypothetical protein